MTVEHVTTPLLRVENLGLRHVSGSATTPILSDVSFELGRGEILGIIGESGAGKSTVGNAILGLLSPEFQQTSGTIEFDGKAIDGMTADERETLRGRRISAIFQDHTASLDPLMSVGAQVEETCLALDSSLSRREARARAMICLPASAFRNRSGDTAITRTSSPAGRGNASSSPLRLPALLTSSSPTSRPRRSMRRFRSRFWNF